MWTQGWHHFFQFKDAGIRPVNGGRTQSLREALCYYWRGNPPQKKTAKESRSAEDAYYENVGFNNQLRKRG